MSSQDQNATMHLGNAFHRKHHTVFHCEQTVRLFSPFPTPSHVNVDGVHAILRVSNQQLSRMQSRVRKAGCNNATLNESHKPVIQQMDNV